MKSVALLLCILAAAQASSYSKIFVMIFENHGYSQVTSNPNWQTAMQNTFQLANYRGVTHPSQPNYLSMIAGSNFNCNNDNDCTISATNLVDLLENGRITWKAYQENYTQGVNGACNLATQIDALYYRKHNPFMSFVDVQTNLTRCQKIVNEAVFQADVSSNSLPQYSFYTPNINDDSHDQSLDYSGQYLVNWLNTWYFGKPTAWQNVLFMITFDEDEGTEGNHVVSFFRGPGITTNGMSSDTGYNHYSMLRFVEDNWGLPTLGRNDTTATSFASELPPFSPTEHHVIKRPW